MSRRARNKAEAEAATYCWVTKDGRSLALKDIGDKHLGNILRMLQNKGHYLPPQLLAEVDKRRLRWQPDANHSCTFDVDGEPCGAEMVMWTAGEAPWSTTEQHPRCGQHRPDAMAFYKHRSCAGCLKEGVVAVFETRSGDLYCEACCTEPEGPAYSLFWGCVWWLFFFVTLGRSPGALDALAETAGTEAGRRTADWLPKEE